MTQPTDNKNQDNNQSNIFRDTAIRYLGYTNEVGESFRYQYPRFVLPSYMIAAGYCLADAGSTGWGEYRNYHNDNKDQNGHSNQAIHVASMATLDTLVWQLLASVLIPGATIQGIVRLTNRSIIISQTRMASKVWSKWIPTGIGLLSIPLIVHPIDQAVDYFMDETIRPYCFPTHQLIKTKTHQQQRQDN